MSQRQAVLQPLNGSNRVAKTVRASAYGKLVQARLNNRLEVDRALEANTTTTTEVNTTTAFRPSGIAPVWAKGRVPMCDSLPYFGIIQGSTYHNMLKTNGNAVSLLINDDHLDRVYIDEEILITRCAGGYANGANGTGGGLRLTKNHTFDMVPAKNLKKSMEGNIPIAVIHGHKSKLLEMELPPNHKFNVLAWFLITDMWFEKMNDDFAGIKLRLEKLDLSEKSWWAKEDSPDPVPHCNRDFSIQPLVNVCESCAEPSSQIFNEGWMCLNEKCGQFWQMEDGAVPDDLTYHNNFLQKRQPPTGIVPDPLVPDFFAAFENEGTVAGIERLNWRGPVCPNCHQCLSRERWNGWRCDCDGGVNGPWEYMVDVDPVVKKVSPGHRAGPFGSDTIPRGSKIVGVVDNKPGTYRKATYTVPDGAGTVLHFFANPALNKRPDGADESLADLQRLARTELDLRRYPLSNAVVDGTLTCHFAQNFGEPYKYVVKVNSTPFSEAPERISKVMKLLTAATEEAATAGNTQFHVPNELLLIGYFEDMEMGYHDDGEAGLGPTITTLSLGGPSTMWIRMKGKYYNGFSKQARAPLKEDPVPPGCLFREDRLRLKARFEAGRISAAQYVQQRKALFAGAQYREPRDSLAMRLEHGDMVVMNGECLQKLYEHSVRPFPGHGVRFAATARFINQ